MQNTLVADKNDPYYNRFKWWILSYVKSGPNLILDLGCANGLLGSALLKQGKASSVDGVEIYPPAAADAAKIYRVVHVGDIESMELEYDGQFDYVVCGDVLEHLKDPYKVVSRIRAWLKPDGRILVCLPNVRNYHVLRALVFGGDWKYISQGIMDNTHLRFFTKKSAARMLEEAGFYVYEKRALLEGPKKNLLNRVTFGIFDEFLAAQIFVCGCKSPTLQEGDSR